MANSKGKVNYAQRLKAIRPFVDFDHDLRKPLSSAAKAQITRYYEYIQKLTVRPHQVYRSKDPARLAAVQRFAQHDPGKHLRLTVAFVPNPGTEKMRLRIDKNGRVHGKTENIAKVEIPLDHARLVKEGRPYIDKAINKAPKAKLYVVQAGEFEVPAAKGRQFITDYVAQLMARYGADQFDREDKNSHYYGNWMFGITGYNFHEQASIEQYRAAQRKQTKQRATKRVNENRKEKRIRENPPGFWINDNSRAVKRARPPQPNGWRQVNQKQFYKALFADGYKEIKDRSKR